MASNKIDNSRKVILALFDIFCFLCVDALYYVASRLLDHTFSYTTTNFLINSVLLMVCTLLVRLIMGIYLNMWRYANTFLYLKVIFADVLGTLIAIVISRIFRFYEDVWIFVTIAALTLLALLASRFCYCLLHRKLNNTDSDTNSQHKIPVAIVGAGQLGVLLADELICNQKSNYRPMFFIDKDGTKIGNRLIGLKVYGQDEKTLDLIKEMGICEIFIAIAKLDSERTAALYDFYSKTSCKIKIYDMPMRDVNDNAEEPLKKGTIREIRIEDLLFRKPMKVKDPATRFYYTGKTVLVTGGGGSIGSELCRQIAKCNPKQLVILDIYENNAYDIQQELLRKYGTALNLAVEIASVRDVERLDAVFAYYRPDVVFHAAAHKHVPLMEHSGCEAIKNNVLGTYNTANMAEKYGVNKFILISTDKAVNPTNIMGASKRMCEMVIQCRTNSETSFAAVRFGNVLGSNGSVIPLFRQQIAQGGPLTITDKRIIRYFMTIPEASSLVLQAGAIAKKGELFVLDMGKPVKIYDLAVNMIRLSGFEPEVDIKIEEIGLRPGEKLYEELLMKTETLTATDNNMIFIEKDTPYTREQIEEKLAILKNAISETKNEIASHKIKDAMKRVVPTFMDPEDVNKSAEDSEEMKLTAEN